MSTSNQLSAFNYAIPQAGNFRIRNLVAAYTVSASDSNVILNCTSGTFTISLTAAATLGSGFNCWVWNLSATSNEVITIDPNGAETIDGATTLVLRRGEGVEIVCDGTNWATNAGKKLRAYSENAALNSTRPVASGNYAIAIGSAFSSGTVASSQYAVAIGATSGGAASQAVTGNGAMALGGSYASGTDSFAAAITDNTSSYGATGAQSAALGRRARATSNNAIAMGNTASATNIECIAIGASVEATGFNAVSIGYFNKATGTASFALGSFAQALETGKFAFSSAYTAAWNYGFQQYGLIVLMRETTDATSSRLTSNAGAASPTNQVIVPNNSAYAFTGTVVARRQASGGTESAAWRVEGLIRREGTAGTTTLVASTVTAISNVPGWTLALSADTTNGGLAVTATGAAATNIRWVATIQTSEVTFA